MWNQRGSFILAPYSIPTFTAAAIASGPSETASAPRNSSGAVVGSPLTLSSVARVPKISSGAVSGNTSSPTIDPPRRKLTVSAAPNATSTLKVGAASSKASASVGNAANGMLNVYADTGTRQISGKSVTSACAVTFAGTVIVIGAGLNRICSRLPSSDSARNNPSSASSDDSSVATHSTPPPTSRNCALVGDNASGKSVTTMT